MKHLHLGDLQPGQKGLIETMDDDHPICQKLLCFGVLPGKCIRYVKAAPMGDPLEFAVEGRNFSLRRKEAQSIRVSLCPEH
jgi:Fe2+ transport system protein FeoA